MNVITSLLAASVITISAAPAALAGSSSSESQMDIVDTAISAGNFETLVTAVQQAGLVDTLKSEGPFTVFAPTDEAFGKIPADQLEELLADKEALAKVLTYHVVAGKVMAADVVKLSDAETVEGQSVAIDSSDGVSVNNATVIATDIEASNGVIHVIDTVLLPPDMAASANSQTRVASMSDSMQAY